MKSLSALFFMAAIPFSASALDSLSVDCDTCVTEAQFTQAAKDKAINRKHIYVSVMNFKNYEIKNIKYLKTLKLYVIQMVESLTVKVVLFMTAGLKKH